MSNSKHRGRMQAQGGGVEKSIPWTQNNPPTQPAGHSMLDTLRNNLEPSEQRDRDTAFEQAHNDIDKAARAGGYHVTINPIKKSFPIPPRVDHRRVDIEIIKGSAFIPETTIQ